MFRLPNWFTTRYPAFAETVPPLNEGEVYVPPPAPPARVITGPIVSTVNWKSIGGQDAAWNRVGNVIQFNGLFTDQLRSGPIEAVEGQLVKFAVSVNGMKNDGTTPNTIRQATGALSVEAVRADGRGLGNGTYVLPINAGTYVAEMLMPPDTHHCIVSLYGLNTTLTGTYNPEAAYNAADWLRVAFTDLERVS